MSEIGAFLGPDPERHVKAISAYLDAGFDEVYVNQIGPDQEGFLDFYAPASFPPGWRADHIAVTSPGRR